MVQEHTSGWGIHNVHVDYSLQTDQQYTATAFLSCAVAVAALMGLMDSVSPNDDLMLFHWAKAARHCNRTRLLGDAVSSLDNMQVCRDAR